MGLTPEQFWRLHPMEFWWMVDARRPEKRYSGMSEQEVSELYDELEQMGVLNG